MPASPSSSAQLLRPVYVDAPGAQLLGEFQKESLKAPSVPQHYVLDSFFPLFLFLSFKTVFLWVIALAVQELAL